MNSWRMVGATSRERSPASAGSTGTSRQVMGSRPSSRAMPSSRTSTSLQRPGSWGRKQKATP